MSYDADADPFNSEHVSDADSVLDMAPPVQSDYYTDNFDRDRPPYLNEQYSRLSTDLELSLDLHESCDDTLGLVAEDLDMPAPGLAAHDGNESSTGSLGTVKGATGPIRPHGFPAMRSNILGAQSGLTEDAVAFHQYCNAHAYPMDTDRWISSSKPLPYGFFGVGDVELHDSLFIAPRSNASSNSGLSSSSWVHVHSNEAEVLDATAALICDAGRQFDDSCTSPLEIDEILK